MSRYPQLRSAILAVSSLGFALPTIAADGGHPLFEFSKPDAAPSWQSVNDSLMEGFPEGCFQITDQGTLNFSGTLSLESNGSGFGAVPTP